jgi:hypothetical protein
MRNVVVKLIVTALATVLLIVHISTTFKLDGVALALLAISLLPWVGAFVEELGVPGFVQLKLRRVETEIDMLNFLVSYMLTVPEKEHLQKIEAREAFEVDSTTGIFFEEFRDEIRHLLNLGFINFHKDKQGRDLFRAVEPNSNLRRVDEYCEIERPGKVYLRLLSKVAKREGTVHLGAE